MIILTTQVVDTSGVVQFDESEESTFGNWTARVSRTKTLNGGVWVNHAGVVDGDRTFTIKATLDEDEAEALEYLYRNYQSINLSCATGFFSGSISTLGLTNGELTMKFYVEEKI